MAERPVVRLHRNAAVVGRDKPKPPPMDPLRTPGREAQGNRLAAMFARLEGALHERRATLQSDAEATTPELVLVLEIAGDVADFWRTVEKSGLEYLFEWSGNDFDSNDGFHRVERETGERVDGSIGTKLYMTALNEKTRQTLLYLWDRYVRGESFEKPFGRWKSVFDQLRAVRAWEDQDRLDETGLTLDWLERDREGETVIIEIELWHRRSPSAQAAATADVARRVSEAGGTVVQAFSLDEIRYQAILANLPVSAVRALIEHRQTQLVRCDSVMFFRPAGQMAAPGFESDDTGPAAAASDGGAPDAPPVIALFDGLPVENHLLLKGRLVVDDPDGWGADYRVVARQHGTGMASLIIHGELDSSGKPVGAALGSKLYVRPVMVARQHLDGFREEIPMHLLTVDLIHRAVRRLFEREGDQPPAQPTVRIINLSIGEQFRPYLRSMGPLARLLDWLALKYGVLFVVSAGNHALPELPSSLAQLSPADRAAAIAKAIGDDARNRRILSPGEAIHALTVGALHQAENTTVVPSAWVEPLGRGHPSVISAVGPGYRSSVKPEVFAPGGRVVLQPPLLPTGQWSSVTRRYGLRTAAAAEGDLSKTAMDCGTSHAAALTSRAAALALEKLRATFGVLSPELETVALRALLVHSSPRDPDVAEVWMKSLRLGNAANRILPRHLGYGTLDEARLARCTDQRITLVAFDRFEAKEVSNQQAHEYVVPLPPSLESKKEYRRLTITLAWNTPTAPGIATYRGAKLWFDPKPGGEPLRVERAGAEWRMVRKGTVQHEVLAGDAASVFGGRTDFSLKVNAQPDATRVGRAVPYALAVTLEVADGVSIPVYDEVEAAVRARAPVSGRAR